MHEKELQTATLESQIRFMQEELAHRERCLSHQLAAGRMSQCKADRELAHLRGVIRSLNRLAVIGNAQ